MTAAFDAAGGTLTAEVVGNLQGATVEPASLPVQIAASEFVLIFTPPRIGILRGEEERVTLSLTGASLSPEEPLVTFRFIPLASDQLASIGINIFGFTSDVRRGGVTLGAKTGAAALGSVTLNTQVSANEVLNASFVNGTLHVQVIDEREFGWAFRARGDRSGIAGGHGGRGGTDAVAGVAGRRPRRTVARRRAGDGGFDRTGRDDGGSRGIGIDQARHVAGSGVDGGTRRGRRACWGWGW